MKKHVIVSLAFLAICESVFAVSADFPIQDLRVVNVCQMTNEDFNEIFLRNRPEMTLEFSAQATLPISFFLTGDLVHLVENGENVNVVEIIQTFYVRCVEQELIFSTDLTEWKSFSEFVTGKASVAFSVKDGKFSINAGAETNKR